VNNRPDPNPVNTLSTRITIIVFWGQVIIGLVFAGFLLHHQESEIRQDRQVIADSIVYGFQVLGEQGGLSSRKIDQEIEKIIARHEDVSVTVSRDGKKIAQVGKGTEANMTDTITRWVRMGNGGDPASLVMEISFPDLKETIHDARKRILIGLGALLLVVGVVLKLMLERILSLPLSRMVQSAREILSGSEAVSFDEGRKDEFGYLAGFINQAMASMRESQEEAFRARELAEITLHSLGDGIVTTDESGRIKFMNPVAERLSGHDPGQAVTRPLPDIMPLVDESTGGSLPHPIHQCLADGRPVDIDTNCALVKRNGDHVPVAISVAPIHDREQRIHGAVMILHDVSEAKSLQRELSYQASHDHLTGLYNRREFDRELRQALLHARRDNHQHTLCYMDLDQFKVINDTCGHAAGDLLLRNLSGRLRESLRKSDVLARLGGDEFALLLLHCTVEQAATLAENLHKLFNDFKFEWEGKTFQVGASIGIAPLSPDAGSVDEVLAAADMACYAAKEQGRNRTHTYQVDDENMLQRRSEMSMVSAVRNALTENLFELFAQPVVPISNRSERGHYEILVRMKTPDGEYLAPGMFLPAAERYQLMPAIDRWVVHHAVTYMAEQAGADNEFTLAINLSGQSINDDRFLTYFIEEIGRHGIDGSRLCLEITESEAVNDLSHAIHFITTLKEHGCTFALDDFGTGVSSFEYLKSLPVDYLKIDGAFIRQLDTSSVDYAMVKAINEVAGVLGMKTIAEFVENERIFDKLGEIGVDYGQGYWIAEPAPAARIIAPGKGSGMPGAAGQAR